jgi:hypothetical protein
MFDHDSNGPLARDQRLPHAAKTWYGQNSSLFQIKCRSGFVRTCVEPAIDESQYAPFAACRGHTQISPSKVVRSCIRPPPTFETDATASILSTYEW